MDGGLVWLLMSLEIDAWVLMVNLSMFLLCIKALVNMAFMCLICHQDN